MHIMVAGPKQPDSFDNPGSLRPETDKQSIEYVGPKIDPKDPNPPQLSVEHFDDHGFTWEPSAQTIIDGPGSLRKFMDTDPSVWKARFGATVISYTPEARAEVALRTHEDLVKWAIGQGLPPDSSLDEMRAAVAKHHRLTALADAARLRSHLRETGITKDFS